MIIKFSIKELDKIIAYAKKKNPNDDELNIHVMLNNYTFLDHITIGKDNNESKTDEAII